MNDIIINDVNYGELVKVGNAYLDRFYADKLGLDFCEATDAHQIITDMYLSCDLGHGQVHVFLLNKEDFAEQAKLFSLLDKVDRVVIQSCARNLVTFQNGVQVGEVRTLDHFYTGISKELLELTDFT